MARKAPEPIDTTRRLAHVDPATGATGVIHNGIIYTRGMEAELPEDFPQDGPWWEDYEPDTPIAVAPRQHSAQLVERDDEQEPAPSPAPVVNGKARRGANRR